MHDINTLELRNFYETNRRAYYERRGSGNNQLWDEQYKWDILPALNQKLSTYGAITRDNIADFIAIIANNSNKSNFAHWIDMDDLKLLAELPYGNQVLDIVWQAAPDTVDEAIDTANHISNSFPPHKKFSPSTWGYILAAKNCDKFAIYRESIQKELVETNSLSKLKGVTQGQKYKLLNDSARYLGELVRTDSADNDMYGQQALNGQDFLWVTLTYHA